jgi:hypothetical protein
MFFLKGARVMCFQTKEPKTTTTELMIQQQQQVK